MPTQQKMLSLAATLLFGVIPSVYAATTLTVTKEAGNIPAKYMPNAVISDDSGTGDSESNDSESGSYQTSSFTNDSVIGCENNSGNNCLLVEGGAIDGVWIPQAADEFSPNGHTTFLVNRGTDNEFAVNAPADGTSSNLAISTPNSSKDVSSLEEYNQSKADGNLSNDEISGIEAFVEMSNESGNCDNSEAWYCQPDVQL